MILTDVSLKALIEQLRYGTIVVFNLHAFVSMVNIVSCVLHCISKLFTFSWIYRPIIYKFGNTFPSFFHPVNVSKWLDIYLPYNVYCVSIVQ